MFAQRRREFRPAPRRMPGEDEIRQPLFMPEDKHRRRD
jgi:hypothetical protein